MLSEKSEGIQVATTTLKKLLNDEKIKLQCEAREKYDHDIASVYASGGRKREKDIALNMLNENISIDIISKVTGLNPDQIQNLK